MLSRTHILHFFYLRLSGAYLLYTSTYLLSRIISFVGGKVWELDGTAVPSGVRVDELCVLGERGRREIKSTLVKIKGASYLTSKKEVEGPLPKMVFVYAEIKSFKTPYNIVQSDDVNPVAAELPPILLFVTLLILLTP